VDAAIVVGQGVDQGTSIVAMRANALEARNAFASGFSSLPGWIPPPVQTAPLLAHPNPSRDQVQFDVLVPAGGARLELDVFDLTGRRVRQLSDMWQPGGVARLSWDGADDSGRHMRAGVYFARSRVAGRDARARVVLLR
jgi:hypothetical protein